jgi:hypothetical protein
MLASAFPGLVEAILAQATTAFAGSTVLIEDGPPLNRQTVPGDVLSVGYQGPDGPAGTSEVTRGTGLGIRRQEESALFCTFTSTTGDTDMKSRRERCRWAVGVIDGALQANPTMGGAVDNCELASVAWEQEQHPGGVTCRVIVSLLGWKEG